MVRPERAWPNTYLISKRISAEDILNRIKKESAKSSARVVVIRGRCRAGASLVLIA